jgi:uncharacterized protein YndB with AHSA1/START domain
MLTSVDGLAVWLGQVPGLEWAKGSTYQLPDGTRGEVRVYKPNSHVRITWQPAGWGRASTIQVRVLPKGDRTTVVFHQEHLPGPQEREERRAVFVGALDELERMMASG